MTQQSSHTSHVIVANTSNIPNRKQRRVWKGNSFSAQYCIRNQCSKMMKARTEGDEQSKPDNEEESQLENSLLSVSAGDEEDDADALLISPHEQTKEDGNEAIVNISPQEIDDEKKCDTEEKVRYWKPKPSLQTYNPTQMMRADDVNEKGYDSSITSMNNNNHCRSRTQRATW